MRRAMPLGLFLNGQMWDATVSETPKNNTTENWYFVNLSGDAHPMHLHLVQFHIVSRQDFNSDKYLADWLKLNQGGLMDGMLPFKMDWQTKVLPFEPYLTSGTRTLALPDEKGWKDVVRAMPGQVTHIRVRFKKQDGRPYEFDPSEGPGLCLALPHHRPRRQRDDAADDRQEIAGITAGKQALRREGLPEWPFFRLFLSVSPRLLLLSPGAFRCMPARYYHNVYSRGQDLKRSYYKMIQDHFSGGAEL